MADGDLTAQFTSEGNDELHAAGKDFNDMAAAFRKLLGRIQSEVQQLQAPPSNWQHQVSKFPTALRRKAIRRPAWQPRWKK